MTDFLLELLSEEIPARMQAKARVDLERLFTAQMAEAGLKAGAITVYSTPRRLALIAKDLPAQTEAVSEEAKGPPEAAPDQAVEGFCRKNGVTRDQLEVRDIKGRPTFFAVINKPGRDTRDVLAEAIPAIIKAFPWPKSMRWGDASVSTESLRWVRPLSGIVAILGDDLVPCEIDGLTSGYDTVGHRFHHQGMITIGNAGDYAEKLRACHVLVDHEERQNIIRDGAAKAASDAGLDLVEDEGLVIENAGLTEWPVPLLGSFDPAFLDVPEEVIQLTARVNQKYFVCKYPPNAQHGEDKLAPNFVCTANIAASDGGKAIIAGNEKVLAARLSDAKFFWELDQKTKLEDHAKKLSNIVFHEKLGTVADKVERVAKLAEWLASLEGTGLLRADPEQTKQAARLCKADLVTEMVGEFPELQGLMGGYYAEKEGLPVEVSHAIRDHYKPVGQGDEVPTDPVTVWVSLADKLDTLVGFFAIDEKPTGSKDPFALRRAAIGILSLITTSNMKISLNALVDAALVGLKCTFQQKDEWNIYPDDENEMGSMHVGDIRVAYHELDLEYAAFDVKAFVKYQEGEVESPIGDFLTFVHKHERVKSWILDFLADRLKVQQREAGVRHDLIDAVFALGGEGDLVRLLARVKALQAFVETPDGVNLLAGYKRASNILKKEAGNSVRVERSRDTDAAGQGLSTSLETNGRERSASSAEQDGAKSLSYTPEKAEKALIDALDAAQPEVTAAIKAEQFETAMTALAALRGPIDQFFEDVTVNDEEEDKREARLALLARFRNAVHQVADFSQIEG
ncbi:glycine--tRNA ligase subunit beta [Sphingorhabdus sp. M41]|uniref:glycine--tRNA ligase subunit beta n=1 Tax=Sphingorhabdus sp. M41 TaxID=1806885 RepID=UPI00078CA77E|nr:glycine--tRNA ligase subunit beta [Sphingorhabdus sp. M41]AMO71653.1 glycine--tRNA ligase subunit beta [Sphingorhabdus sp. M41]